MNDNILSSSDTTTDSILEPYLKTREKNNTEKDDERRQTKRKCKDANLEANNTSNTLNNEWPNKRMCNAERSNGLEGGYGLRARIQVKGASKGLEPSSLAYKRKPHLTLTGDHEE
ncbi:hypothetical protein Tco_0484096 [Tanacetum coccineum]